MVAFCHITLTYSFVSELYKIILLIHPFISIFFQTVKLEALSILSPLFLAICSALRTVLGTQEKLKNWFFNDLIHRSLKDVLLFSHSILLSTRSSSDKNLTRHFPAPHCSSSGQTCKSNLLQSKPPCILCISYSLQFLSPFFVSPHSSRTNKLCPL